MILSSLRRYLYYGLLFLLFVFGVWAERSGFIETMLEYEEDVVYLIVEHLQLTLISGGLAVLIGVPLGILLSRPSARGFAENAMQVLNIGSTVPTLALLALSMSFLGIGNGPAIFGLLVVTLLPIVRNCYTGLLAVPAHLKEAAEGMGMTSQQMLWKV